MIDTKRGELSILVNHDLPIENSYIALHGWLDNAYSFAPIMALADAPAITAIDLPGHGKTYHRPQFSYYHFIDWISDIASILKALHVTRPVKFIGHSMGGLIAHAYSAIYPREVNKLILIDMIAAVMQNKEDAISEIRSGLNSREKVEQQSQRPVTNIEQIVHAKMAANNINYEAAKQIVTHNIGLSDEQNFWRYDQKLKAQSPIKLSESIVLEMINEITIPVLLIKGEQGYESVNKGITKFSSFYHDLTVVEAEGGHHCHINSPSQTLHFINNF